jgi:hypothetical protein
MKCEKCGYTMTRAKSSKTGFGMYICLNTKRGTCGGVSISMDKTDQHVEQQLLDRFDPAKIEASRLSYEAEKKATLSALPQGHADELKDLGSKYDIITEMLLEEASPAARTRLKARMDEIAKRIDELQTYKHHEPKTSPISIILDGAEVAGHNLKDLWPTLRIETKNAIIRSATEGIQIKGVLRNQSDGKGRFTYDTSRIVIWWREEEKPAEWDEPHASHAQLATDPNAALV